MAAAVAPLHPRSCCRRPGARSEPSWYEVGRFLGPSIEELYAQLPLERQLELWRAAGISGVGLRRMSLGGGVVIWGVRDG